MKKAEYPDNEQKRLAALRQYRILDTPPEQVFDDLAWLASEIAGVPIALISLVDMERQWFKAKVGLDAPETPRDISFCGHAIHHETPLIVPNTLEDQRFHDNPLVTGAPDIRFYMGIPLTTPEAFNLGTLCVIDQIPREMSELQIKQIKVIAKQVVNQLELRLAATELRKAAREAQDQAQKRTEFIAHMSHEIRTPMNGIMGMTDLLLSGPLEDPLRENLQVIHDSGKSLLRHLDGVLDLTKVEANKIEFEMLDFELKKQITRTLCPFKVIAESKGLTFSLHFDPQLPAWVTGDPTRLEQVLTNLVGNAVKFTSEGEVSVEVRGTVVRDQGVQLTFVVSDTGPGIPSDRQSAIFEPYVQASAATTRQHGGTGLGLSIVSKLVQMMGGEIQVRSTFGEGTRFVFNVVLAPGTPPSRSAQDAPEYKSAPPSTVLLVEDNAFNQVVLSKILKRLGHTVVLAENAKQALDTISIQCFDLILMDVELPGMNGWDAVVQIRKTEARLKQIPIPIIMLTGHATPDGGDPQHLVDGFLSKPVSVASIGKAIQKVLGTAET